MYIISIILLAVLLFGAAIRLKPNYKKLNINIDDALLGTQELIRHAVLLAKAYRISSRKKSKNILTSRLEYDYRIISSEYRKLTLDGKNGVSLCPSTEWLLDNFYIIEENFKKSKKTLNKEFFKKLYIISNKSLEGLPRIFTICAEFISHTDGKIEKNQLIEFINAFQSVTPLSMAELWSLGPMLRAAVLERIQSICIKISDTQNSWILAEKTVFEKDMALIDNKLEEINSRMTVDSAFVEHIVSTLKREDIEDIEIIQKLQSGLFKKDYSLGEVVGLEHKSQSEIQMCIGNCISSLRLISSISWEEIFDSLSKVEKILSSEDSGLYKKQDIETRKYYRSIVEKLSLSIKISETSIASAAVELARAAEAEGNSIKSYAVYYLGSEGRKELFKRLDTSDNVKIKREFSLFSYIFLCIILTALFCLVPAYYALSASNSLVLSIAAFVLGLIPTSEISFWLLNKVLLSIYPPSFLPRLDFEDGLPEDCSTSIIVPTIIPSVERLKELFSQLEVAYAASYSGNMFFVLLGDFIDSETETNPEDNLIITEGMRIANELNNRYSSNGKNIFYFIIRKRYHLKNQNRWMGWERKRGAIVQYCRLIRGIKSNTILCSGDTDQLHSVKYILTLDADTFIPIGTASKLIGTIAHPVNKAVLDSSESVVVSGYALIQPHIGITIDAAYKTLFTKIFAGPGGIDTYSSAGSDLYQDVWGEGIFTGKGIFDCDIFLKTAAALIPENRVLSHDLLEGCYLRTGLTSGIELLDGFPSKYNSYALRLNRWIRGDWQILGYIQKKVVNASGVKVNNPFNSLSKWKIIDNLRRSLVHTCTLLLIFAGCCFLPGRSYFWILFAAVIQFFPFIRLIPGKIADMFIGNVTGKTSSKIIYGIKAAFWSSFLQLMFLPHIVKLQLDAIVRSLYRLYISGNNLLQWTTAAEAEKLLKNNLKSYIRSMIPPAALSSFIILLPIAYGRNPGILSIILIVLWLTAPIAAYKISKPCDIEERPLSNDDIIFLRELARKTYAFYEDYSGETDNYLPPDNLQINPIKKVAHRTSPTNIGFLFAAHLAGKDLGFITLTAMLDKLNHTLDTLDKLDKWNGHLYNWYDTKSLKLLRPRYVSTVDSGNFTAFLITAAEGIKDILLSKLSFDLLISGIEDTIRVSTTANYSSYNELFSCIKEMPPPSSLYKITSEITAVSESPDIWENKALHQIIELQKELKMLFLQYDDTKDLAIPKKFMADEKLMKLSLPELEIYYTELLSDRNKWSKADSIVKQIVKNKLQNITNIIQRCRNTVARIEKMAADTDFTVLYDKKVGLFSIGWNIEEDKITNSYYDLLASESRITSYLAVVRKEVPVSHWFRLSRSLADISGYRSLVSWTGTMFEYFMPPIIMKPFKNTMLNETYSTVLKEQIKYGNLRKVPWGTSESGFYLFDLLLNYQYKAFGVPDLGLKRGLIDDMVVSPYSTALALPFNAEESVKNLRRLTNEGLSGVYGLYEAVDYTPERIPENTSAGIVESFMAHHQGMILSSVLNTLMKNILIERFHRPAYIKAGEFLLQEKIPINMTITKDLKETVAPLTKTENGPLPAIRRIKNIDTYPPACHLLSNGCYTLLINSRGSGFSKTDSIYLNRWREGPGNNGGIYIFIKDVRRNCIWSSFIDPSETKPQNYQVQFTGDKAICTRRDGDYETRTEICITPEDNCEIRRIRILNDSDENSQLEITSYMEAVLNEWMADVIHPAFSNLFMQTEFIPETSAIIAKRRPREESGHELFCFHSIYSSHGSLSDIQYETDRNKFLGRNKTIKDAAAVSHPLTGSQGAVLDPILSLRKSITLPPQKSAEICFIFGTSESREGCIELSRKYSDPYSVERSFELAYIRSRIALRHNNLKSQETELFDNLLSHIIYYSPLKERKPKSTKMLPGQKYLWPMGISGDNPIMLLKVNTSDGIDTARDMIKAHQYYHSRGLITDLVILVYDEDNYLKPIYNLLKDSIFSYGSRDILDTYGGIFLKDALTITDEQKELLSTYAKLEFTAENGRLKNQYRSSISKNRTSDRIIPSPYEDEIKLSLPERKLEYYNEYGGYDSTNMEYVIILKKDMSTPAPWINVISGRNFGFFISESGAGNTWFGNSRENKITPWYNDPVSDLPGEIFYIRNNITGEYWNPTPGPARSDKNYCIRHGAGYSVFESQNSNVQSTLTICTPFDESIKISLLELKNISPADKNLSLYYLMKPVLGVTEQITQQFIDISYDKGLNAFILRNPCNDEYHNNICFIGCSENISSYSLDAIDFAGISGSLKSPESLEYRNLSNSDEVSSYASAAMQTDISIKPGETITLSYILGVTDKAEEIPYILNMYREPENCKNAINDTATYWKNYMKQIQVSTPDEGMNIMLNQFLIYQTVSCRLMARTAFYQSGGAYGFRDQLQDILSLINISPEEVKAQILLHASHQFNEGDVLHWWHSGNYTRGVRTRFSDDLLWLPYAVSEYIHRTGDYEILKITIPYIKADLLKDGEDEKYTDVTISSETDNLYVHCKKAIKKSLTHGPNGLPLMGSGDWNDGMNQIGNKGKGESIWLGWFLYDIINRFLPISEYIGDNEFTEEMQSYAKSLLDSLNTSGWDGSWYRRAYFDDGTPIGSSLSNECKIDSIAQSWAVISGGAPEDKAELALKSLEDNLILHEEGMILLFAPPFNNSELNPGYIKGYVPGVRENGGQYTHAAVWVIYAFAKRGLGEKAFECFRLLNPLNHTRTPIEVSRYKVEPYVLAADLYTVENHVGRGGWTWYTGSSGWMYRAGIEEILGFKAYSNFFRVNPCIPESWKSYSIKYNTRGYNYTVDVLNPIGVSTGVSEISLDGNIINGQDIPLLEDGLHHTVKVTMG